MAPVREVGHVRRRLAVVAGREEVELIVVPAIACGTGDRPGSAKGLGVTAGTPHGKVLTIATAANAPKRLLANTVPIA